MLKFIKDIFTEKDGVSFCLTSTLMILGGLAMIGEFLYRGSVDFTGLGLGLAALAAGKAAKTLTEKDGQ